MKGMGEEVLREPVRCFLEKKGYEVFDEVPIGGRFADLLGIRQGDVVAVELKLAQWRVALAQSRAYQLGAQLVYVAFPQALALRLLRTPPVFDTEGIGLLGISPEGEVRELLPARASSRFLPFLSEGVIEGARASTEGLTASPALASLLADLWEAEA